MIAKQGIISFFNIQNFMEESLTNFLFGGRVCSTPRRRTSRSVIRFADEGVVVNPSDISVLNSQNAEAYARRTPGF